MGRYFVRIVERNVWKYYYISPGLCIQANPVSNHVAFWYAQWANKLNVVIVRVVFFIDRPQFDVSIIVVYNL